MTNLSGITGTKQLRPNAGAIGEKSKLVYDPVTDRSMPYGNGCSVGGDNCFDCKASERECVASMEEVKRAMRLTK